MRRDDVRDATRLYILDLAAHPDAIGEVEPWWETRFAPRARIGCEFQPWLCWTSAIGTSRQTLSNPAPGRSVATRRAGPRFPGQAVHTGKPFAPAYRQLVLEDWVGDDWTNRKSKAPSDDLATLQKAGDSELADEVRGVAAMSDKRPDDAATFFSQAVAGGGSSPQLLLTYATALRQAKQDPKAEQLLWKLVVPPAV